MHDFKYRKVITGEAKWRDDLNQVRSECLHPLCKAFEANLVRAMTFAFTPAEIAFRAACRQRWADYTILKITGKLDSDLPDTVNEKPTGDEINRRLEQLHNDFYSRPWKEIEGLKDELGIRYVVDLLKSNQGMQQFMEALLSAVVLESWTAFECLASDLWVVGVDNGPPEIVARINIASPKAFKQPDDSIRPETIHKLGIDAKKNYGSFLRAIGKVTFQTLSDIQKYCGFAFGKDAHRLFDEVAGGYIFALSAFRNALIHNAGKADKQFLKQLERFPELSGIKLSEKIPLDGELVRNLRNAPILLGTRLIQFVDNVLTPARSENPS